MGFFSPDKERDRFYLLPGMGGRALQRKRRQALWWSLAVGLGISLALAAVMYFFHRRDMGL